MKALKEGSVRHVMMQGFSQKQGLSQTVALCVVLALGLNLMLSAFAQDSRPDYTVTRSSSINLEFRAGNLLTCVLKDLEPQQTLVIQIELESLGTDPLNRSDLFATVLAPANDLMVETTDFEVLDDGQRVRYALAISNQSEQPIDNVLLTEPLPFDIRLHAASENCEASFDEARTLLLSHLPPDNANYVAGSSLLNGTAANDPLIGSDGRLFWLLPYQAEGQLRYQLSHSDALADIPAPSVTLRVAERDVFLAGQISFSDLPLEFDLFIGDEDAFSLQLSPRYTRADARNPIELELYVVAPSAFEDVSEETDMQEASSDVLLDTDEDELELPSYITIESPLDPIDADAEPLISGYQVAVDDNGFALLRFEPQVSAREVPLRLGIDDQIVSTAILLTGADRALYQYQGSLLASFNTEATLIEGLAQAYLELPLADGTLQGALDIGADFDSNPIEDADAFNLDTDRGLRDETDPTDRFPLTGSGTEAEPALRSDDGIALKYDQAEFSVGYYAGDLAAPGVGGFNRATALFVESFGDLKFQGFAALQAEATVSTEITPDGTRRYTVGEAIAVGSERLVIVTVDGEEALQKNKDYTINYLTGVISLAKPLWPSDLNFNPVHLRVDYAPENARRDQINYGLGASYQAGNVQFGVGVADVDGVRIGADVAYSMTNFSVGLRYTTDILEGNFENSRFTLTANGNIDNVSASANLTYTDSLDVRGRARAAYEVISGGSIALEHEGSLDSNRSGLLYEQNLNRLLSLSDANMIDVGAGLGYTWETSTLNGLGRARYSNARARVELTHSQPFDFDEQSVSTLIGSYLINPNLTGDASLAYAWGNDFEGTLGLNQRLGDANLSLNYQLPTGSGEGNRARFGVDVPFNVTPEMSFSVNAGYERFLDDGIDEAAIGAATRYSTEDFNATLGGEVAFPSEGDTKVVVRAGAAGQINRDQTLSADANYQVTPDLNGSFTVAYALKRSHLNLLTYHRLNTDEEGSELEGELTPTYVFNRRFQIRPGFAYRVNFADADINTYQLTLGGLHYFNVLDFRSRQADGVDGDQFGEDVLIYPLAEENGYDPTFGIGAFAHYAFQPANSGSDLGFSVEGSAQVLEPLWITLGYTFDEFQGITTNSQGGFYVRLDVLGVGQ